MQRDERIATMIAAARAELGTRWRHQGRCAGVALDCVGLVLHAARAAGLDLPKMADYARRPVGADLLVRLGQVAIRAGGAPVAGQVAVMRHDGVAQHVALVVGPGRIIHGFAPARKVVETALEMRRLDSLWWLTGLEP